MSLLQGIVLMKCPRCRKGNLFVESNPYNLKMLSKMPERCPHCGQLTEPEPAFYYGAMYLSYGLSIVISFLNYFFFEVLLNAKGVLFLALNAFVLILLWPVIFRYARILYIYLFVSYDPSKK
jgi:hypothetical protein